MLKPSWGVFGLILCAVVAVSLTAAADVGSEVFVVSSSLNGDANYMSVTDDPDAGTFSSQEILQQTSNTTTITDFFKFSYGNGLGDFDNDGDLDYIMAMGFGSGSIYISEKLDAGNQFALPRLVDTWGQDGGMYAMDFAVADYNEDGNADFVLSLGYNSASGLYLGDGAFGFESEPLLATAASASAGADAADFNNDGHADFVIAPSSDEKFFVSLGDGTGKFATTSFSSHDGGAVWGVAAADFTGDGIADIAAAHFDYLYIYEGAIVEGEWDIDENDEWVKVGNGGTIDGVAFTYLASYELPMNQSAIDNYDFNGDGNQDLVVASYAADKAGVAVFFGNGDGTFTYNNIYLGGSVNERNAVTAAPWEPVNNIEPVAVIEPAYLEVTVGDEIVFDGSNSFDEDGRIVSYEWDFGEAAANADVGVMSLMSMTAADPKTTGVSPSYTYQKSGTYLVTLWVTDDKGSTTSVEAEVAVLDEPLLIAVKVRFFPGKVFFNGKKTRYLKAKIEFPEEYDARKVDLSSVYIVTETGAEIYSNVKKESDFLEKISQKSGKRKKSITVKFNRQAVLETLACPPAGETELTVRGKIFDDNTNTWEEFAGTGVIRLKMKKKSSCSAD